jgi:hypothetical protein
MDQNNIDQFVMDYRTFLERYAPVIPMRQIETKTDVDKPIKNNNMTTLRKPKFSFNENWIHARLVDELSSKINIILTDMKITQDSLAQDILFNPAWISLVKNKQYSRISSSKVLELAISFGITIDGFHYKDYIHLVEWNKVGYAAKLYEKSLIAISDLDDTKSITDARTAPILFSDDVNNNIWENKEVENLSLSELAEKNKDKQFNLKDSLEKVEPKEYMPASPIKKEKNDKKEKNNMIEMDIKIRVDNENTLQEFLKIMAKAFDMSRQIGQPLNNMYIGKDRNEITVTTKYVQ